MQQVEPNQIISYREMCNIEDQQQLQRGMNYGMGGEYSIILMSIKTNAPYADRVSEDGLTIYYEGHDLPGDKTKRANQPMKFAGGSFTQNGLFATAVDNAIEVGHFPLVRVYEKLKEGIWNYRGLFEMKEYDYIERDGRYVFEFTLTLTNQDVKRAERQETISKTELEQTRQIPGSVKLAVYKRDKGMCRVCQAKDNLHFDHIFPYSKNGTSLLKENIQLLCARHNLQKSNHIQ